MIAGVLAVGSFLLIWLPGVIVNWWSLGSTEPFFVWVGKQNLIAHSHLTFSPLWITGIIGSALLIAILWALLSGGKTESSTPEKTKAAVNPTSELRIEADPSIKGCYTLNIVAGGRTTKYLHAAVSLNAGQVTNCKAYLTRISKDGIDKFNGQEQLTFSPSEAADSLGKTIHHGITSFFDVLAITIDDGEIHLCNEKRQWLRWPRLRDIFSEHAKYLLTISVAADGVPTLTKDFVFDWTGNWQTSFLFSGDHGSISSPPQPLFVGLDSLKELLQEGEQMLENFTSEHVTLQLVRDYRARTLSAARGSTFSAVIGAKDIQDFEEGSLDDLGVARMAELADENEAFMSPERIEVYNLLHNRVTRMRQLVAKIEARDSRGFR